MKSAIVLAIIFYVSVAIEGRLNDPILHTPIIQPHGALKKLSDPRDVEATAESTDVESTDGASEIPLCTKDRLSSIQGYLLDLDGTLYGRLGLLKGVQEFFDFLETSGTPYALLSNGFKTAQGVASKFAMKQFKLKQTIDPNQVHTAGVAIARYMTDNVPKNSKVYAIGTSVEYSDGRKDSLTRILKQEVPSQLFDTWEVRTDLNMSEIYTWAHGARDLGEDVYVVQAFMGSPNDGFADDPVTGRSGYSTIDYSLLIKMNTLLRNGAGYIVGAPDAADSQPRCPQYANIDTAWPTMGGFEHLLLASAEMLPGSEKEKARHVNVGKGGNRGGQYMMEPGIEMLQVQHPNIKRENIMMVGDNFGTDIKAAVDAGCQSMLVLVGAHRLADAVNWPAKPTCYLQDVGEIPKVMNEG